MYWSIKLLQEEVEKLENEIAHIKRVCLPVWVKIETNKCKKLIDDYNSAIELLKNKS